MTKGKIIHFQEVDIIDFLLQSKKIIIMLLNIVYALKCDLNLILLEQFCKSEILY